MPRCPKCSGHNSLAQYADSFGLNNVYVIYKCPDCHISFRKREKLPGAPSPTFFGAKNKTTLTKEARLK